MESLTQVKIMQREKIQAVVSRWNNSPHELQRSLHKAYVERYGYPFVAEQWLDFLWSSFALPTGNGKHRGSRDQQL